MPIQETDSRLLGAVSVCLTVRACSSARCFAFVHYETQFQRALGPMKIHLALARLSTGAETQFQRALGPSKIHSTLARLSTGACSMH